MTVTCPTCRASLTIPDERLPRDRTVTAACPHCKGKVIIDPTISTAAATTPAPIPPAEAPATYEEQRQPRALVCVAPPAEQEQVLAALRREGYTTQVATNAAEAIERLRFTAYALVVIREGFGSPGGDGSPVLDLLAEMGMGTRRQMHVVLVSPHIRSHDTATAFARSVNLVIHANDLPHLAEALKRSRAEAEQAYRVFWESLQAMGKA